MMSRRLYLLITRSALLLIAALVSAPIVDFWRFGSFTPTGSARLPLGVVIASAHEEPGGSRADAGAEVVASQSQAPVPSPAPQAPARPAEPERGSQTSAAPPRATSPFEAWTAWGQVDPFWDGNDRPARVPPADAIVAATPEPAPGEAHPGPHAVAARDESSRRRTAQQARADRKRPPNPSGEPRVEEADDEDDDAPAEGEPDAGDGTVADPSFAGWVIGQPPPENEPDESRVAPEPTPNPVPRGGPSVGPPRTPPAEPRPKPISYPTAWIDAPSQSVGIGEVFNVTVRVDSVEAMTSLPFHLMFNPGIVGYESAQTGPALGALQPVLLASVNPNRPGDLAVGLSLIESAGSFSGSGNVIVLTFRALASGRSDLAFGHATLRGATSEAVDTRFNNGSVIVR